MGETYYERNRDAVLERQRLRRCDPDVRERQRQYCSSYYMRCRDLIIARSRAKRLGLPHLLKVAEPFRKEHRPVVVTFD